jgi:hypothetical protein
MAVEFNMQYRISAFTGTTEHGARPGQDGGPAERHGDGGSKTQVLKAWWAGKLDAVDA